MWGNVPALCHGLQSEIMLVFPFQSLLFSFIVFIATYNIINIYGDATTKTPNINHPTGK